MRRWFLFFCLSSICLYAGDFQEAVNIRTEYRLLLAKLRELERRAEQTSDEYKNEIYSLRRQVSYYDGLYAQQLRILKKKFLRAGSKQAQENSRDSERLQLKSWIFASYPGYPELYESLHLLRKQVETLKKDFENGFIEEDSQSDRLVQIGAEISVASQVYTELIKDLMDFGVCSVIERDHDFLNAATSVLYVASQLEQNPEKSRGYKARSEHYQRLFVDCLFRIGRSNSCLFGVDDIFLRIHYFEITGYNVNIHAILASRGLVNLARKPLQTYIERLEGAGFEDSDLLNAIALMKGVWSTLREETPEVWFEANPFEELPFESQIGDILRIRPYGRLPDHHDGTGSEWAILSSEFLIGTLERISRIVFSNMIDEKSPYGLRLISRLREFVPTGKELAKVAWGQDRFRIDDKYYVFPDQDWGKQKIEESYNAVENNLKKLDEKVFNFKDFISEIRQFLAEGADKMRSAFVGKSPYPAMAAYAKFISESVRNIRTWIVNLMLLDLLETPEMSEWIKTKKAIDKDDDIVSTFFKLHPMAGSSWKDGKFTSTPEIEGKEKVIMFNWLRTFWPYSGDQFDLSSKEESVTQLSNAAQVATQHFEDIVREMFFQRALTTNSFEHVFEPRRPHLEIRDVHRIPPELCDYHVAMERRGLSAYVQFVLTQSENRLAQSSGLHRVPMVNYLQINTAELLDHTIIQVRPVDNAGEGECGFLALGTTRRDFINAVTNPTPQIEQILQNFPPEGGREYWLSALARGLYVGDLELRLLAEMLQRRIMVFVQNEDRFIEHRVYGANFTDILRIAHVGTEGVRNHFIQLALPVAATVSLSRSSGSVAPVRVFK